MDEELALFRSLDDHVGIGRSEKFLGTNASVQVERGPSRVAIIASTACNIVVG